MAGQKGRAGSARAYPCHARALAAEGSVGGEGWAEQGREGGSLREGKERGKRRWAIGQAREGMGARGLTSARHLAVGESPKGAANTSYMGKCDKGSAYTKLAAALLQRA